MVTVAMAPRKNIENKRLFFFKIYLPFITLLTFSLVVPPENWIIFKCSYIQRKSLGNPGLDSY